VTIIEPMMITTVRKCASNIAGMLIFLSLKHMVKQIYLFAALEC